MNHSVSEHKLTDVFISISREICEVILIIGPLFKQAGNTYCLLFTKMTAGSLPTHRSRPFPSLSNTSSASHYYALMLNRIRDQPLTMNSPSLPHCVALLTKIAKASRSHPHALMFVLDKKIIHYFSQIWWCAKKKKSTVSYWVAPCPIHKEITYLSQTTFTIIGLIKQKNLSKTS